MRGCLCLFIVVAGTVSCTPEEAPPEEIAQTSPSISLARERVVFDPVEVGVDSPRTVILEVENQGDATLVLEDLSLTGEDGEYFEIGYMEPPMFLVDPGRITEVPVVFAPTTAVQAAGELVLRTNDPDRPEARVALEGEGIAPVARVDAIDLGAPYIGCEHRVPVEIVNMGTSTLVVHELELTASFHVELPADLVLPVEIAPMESLPVDLRYTALDTSGDVGWLVVRSNDPWLPELTAQMSGAGTYFSQVTDAWEQSGVKPADILFTLSRAGSMTDDNALVASNLEDFARDLPGIEADYHVAVAVQDDGCFLGDYVTNGFSASEAVDAIEVMADMYFALGTYGANTERGFSLAQEALKPSLNKVGGCNEGFLRDSATLDLVHISDDPEQSTNPYTHYVSWFQGLKSDPSDVTVHAVAGDYPGGCGSASAGTGYYEAAVLTGGHFLSICDSKWASDLDDLVSDSPYLRTTFELGHVPVVQTLEVWVDEVQLPSGWVYEPEGNAIAFEDASVPAIGAIIDATYHELPDCQ